MVSNRSVICPTNARQIWSVWRFGAHLYSFCGHRLSMRNVNTKLSVCDARAKIFQSSGVCTSEYCQCHFSSQTKRCAQTINLNLMNLEREAKKSTFRKAKKRRRNGTWQWTLSFPIFGGKIAFAIYVPWVSVSSFHSHASCRFCCRCYNSTSHFVDGKIIIFILCKLNANRNEVWVVVVVVAGWIRCLFVWRAN